MNMRKALAAGVAATLAVTSMAAFASADNQITTIIDAAGNTKTFNMNQTYGYYKLKSSVTLDRYANGLNLAGKFSLTDDEWKEGARLGNRGDTSVAASISEALVAIGEAASKIEAYENDIKKIDRELMGYYVDPSVDAVAEQYDPERNYNYVLSNAKSAYEAAKKAEEDAAAEAGETPDPANYAAEKLDYEKLLEANIGSSTFTDADGNTIDWSDQEQAWADLLKDKATYTKNIADLNAEIDTNQAKIDSLNAASVAQNTKARDAYSVTNYADYLEVTVDKDIAKGITNAADLQLAFAVEGVYGTRTNARGVKNYKLIPVASSDSTKFAYRFYIYGDVAPEWGFQPNQFLEITNVKLIWANAKELDANIQRVASTSATGVKTYKTVKLTGLTEEEFNTVGSNNPSATILSNLGLDKANGFHEGDKSYVKITRNFDNISNTLKTNIAAGKDVTAENTDEYNLYDQFEILLEDVSGADYTLVDNSKTTKEVPAFIPRTTVNDGDNIVGRNQVWLLSGTGAQGSGTVAVTSTGFVSSDLVNGATGQTYEGSYYYGTMPKFFAGLASQVADFFNKWENGSITFKLAYSHGATAASGWTTGGVPSTEVGVKTLLGQMTQNNIALFFNYGSTTGSLQAVTSIDVDAGEIKFDISDILDALDGRTIGTVQDIYYGLNKGLDKYADGIPLGLYIGEVKLERTEADVAATEDITDEIEDDTADDIVEDDTDTAVEIEDDTDDVAAEDEDIPTEEDFDDDFEDDSDDESDDFVDDFEDGSDDESDDFIDDSDDVDDFVDDSDQPTDVDDDFADDFDDTADDTYVEPQDDDAATIDDTVAPTPAADDVAGDDVIPTITPSVETDENPGTGVALAVVPAALAAAAIVISKKRK